MEHLALDPLQREDREIDDDDDADASTTNTFTLHLNTRYPVTDMLRINPRLRLDYRQFELNDGTQWITTPSLRFDYRYRRNVDLDADIGS